MSESCLLISPASRNEGMGPGSGMGINSMNAVSDVGTVTDPERSPQMDSSLCTNNSNEPQSSRDVTEDREFSERETKKQQENVSSGREQAREEDTPSDNDATPKRKIGSLQRSGPVLEEGEGDTSGLNSESEPSRPQHERIEPVEPMDISYSATPASLRLKDFLVSRLDVAAHTGRVQVVDLSRRGLQDRDAGLIQTLLRSNPQLAVLKLGYNNLGDNGASVIASSCSKGGRHHQGLTVLDLGFNNIGDEGCTELSLHMIAGNYTLRNLYLSGNQIRKRGAMALAGAILHGCSLARLHLTANKLGPTGMKVLAGALAEMDARRQHLLQRQGGIVVAAVKPQAIETLHLGDISMQSQGLVTLSSMLASNQNLRVLGLCNNGIDDRDMALLSQAFAQNKSLPLTTIHLSFNKITDVGVECFMNAIWGSKMLKEVKLDNNKMQDRGAQLCSVVLGSISLEVLDISFNRVSTVGIKAIMKSISENKTMRDLSLSGIPMDQNASKAVSYAIAYNQSLEKFHIDSCCIGYSGQRHIVAGIVSNRNVKLRAFTGFPLGPITKTLGLPQVPEDWGNDRVLSFVRFMWSYWRAEDPSQNTARGPAPPSVVAASGKKAFAALSTSDACKVQFQKEYAAAQTEQPPVMAPDTTILVRSGSGQNLQIPAWGDGLGDEEGSWSGSDSLDRSSYSGSSQSLNQSDNFAAVDPERRNKNLKWLRKHFQSLNEVGGLSFNNADLWQLNQYFYSPAYTMTDEIDSEPSNLAGKSRLATASSLAVLQVSQQSKIGTSVSVKQFESDQNSKEETRAYSSRPNKRGSLEEALKDTEPCAKRAKNYKPRIAYFPRIREKLEALGMKPSAQTLSLLRQLKYIESTMLQGINVYVDESPENDNDGARASDVEMILLDLL